MKTAKNDTNTVKNDANTVKNDINTAKATPDSRPPDSEKTGPQMRSRNKF